MMGAATDKLATFTLFPLSPVLEAGDNVTEKLLITLNHVSYTIFSCR